MRGAGRRKHSGAGWEACPACRARAGTEAALVKALPKGRGDVASVAVVGLLPLDGAHGAGRSPHCELLAKVAAVAGTDPLYTVPGDRLVLLSTRPAEQLRGALEHLAVQANRTLAGGWVASGLARCGGGLSRALEEATGALRAAAAGRGTVVTAPPRRQGGTVGQASADAVRGLLAGAGEIAVAYQPVLALSSGELLGYEALMRPRGGRIDSPALAFDIAGRIGLAAELDRACRDAVLADAPGLDMRRGQLLFVNVAPQAFVHPEFATAELVEAVRAAGLPPQRVVLEVRDEAAVEPDDLAAQSARLRAAGFRVALDDVGGPHSRLETLWRCEVDYLKVDESLTQAASRDPAARALFQSLCALAGQLGSTLVAEGVENDRLLRFVRAVDGRVLEPLAVQAAQGYVLGRPGPRPQPEVHQDDGCSSATGEPAASGSG